MSDEGAHRDPHITEDLEDLDSPSCLWDSLSRGEEALPELCLRDTVAALLLCTMLPQSHSWAEAAQGAARGVKVEG